MTHQSYPLIFIWKTTPCHYYFWCHNRPKFTIQHTHCKGVVTHSTPLTSWIFISIHPFLPTVFDRKSHQIANRSYIECQVTFSQTFPFGDLWLRQLLMDSDFFNFWFVFNFFQEGITAELLALILAVALTLKHRHHYVQPEASDCTWACVCWLKAATWDKIKQILAEDFSTQNCYFSYCQYQIIFRTTISLIYRWRVFKLGPLLTSRSYQYWKRQIGGDINASCSQRLGNNFIKILGIAEIWLVFSVLNRNN